MTDVSVRLNGVPHPGTIVFAGNRDLGFINVWRDKLVPEDADSRRRAAVDIAQLAIDSFLAHSRVQQFYAKSIEEISAHIKADKHCEVAGLVLMKCGWLPDSEVIGVGHFRRTWSNNIVLDYLAAFPFATKPPAIIKGVGSALLWFISD